MISLAIRGKTPLRYFSWRDTKSVALACAARVWNWALNVMTESPGRCFSESNAWCASCSSFWVMNAFLKSSSNVVYVGYVCFAS